MKATPIISILLLVGSFSLSAQDGIKLILTIDQPDILEIEMPTSVEVTANQATLSEVTVNGGVEPYSYLWTPESLFDDPNDASPFLTVSSPTTIQVTVTDGNGCTTSREQEVFVLDPLGIEIKDSSISIYPVPTSGVLTIEAPHSDFTIDLHNLSGQLKLRAHQKLAKSFLDLSRLSPGMYLITMHRDGEIFHSQPITVK